MSPDKSSDFKEKFDAAELLSKSLLTFLNVARSNIGPKGIKFLSSLPLTDLGLAYNHVDDEGMSVLTQMKYLEKLNLAHNKITLKELKPFPNMMTRLTSLNLQSNRIEDDQVAILAEFKQLKELNIADNVIDVKGALILSEFTHLTSLTFWREIRLSSPNLGIESISKEAQQIFEQMKYFVPTKFYGFHGYNNEFIISSAVTIIKF